MFKSVRKVSLISAAVAALSVSCIAHAASPAEEAVTSQVETLSKMVPFELGDGVMITKVSGDKNRIIYDASLDIGKEKMDASDRASFEKGLRKGGCQAPANRLMMSKGIAMTFNVSVSDGNKISSTMDASSCNVKAGESNKISDDDLTMITEKLSKSLPMQVDNMTTMRAIRHSGKMKMSYEYEVSSTNLKKIEKTTLDKALPLMSCSDASVAAILEGGVTVEMKYFEKESGKLWHSVPVSAATCSKKG